DEQQWPAVLEPVERVDFLDLCFADGTAGSEVEVLEARSQGKARGFDAIAGFTCLAIVGFSLQQRIEQLCVTDLIARCLVHAPIERVHHAEQLHLGHEGLGDCGSRGVFYACGEGVGRRDSACTGPPFAERSRGLPARGAMWRSTSGGTGALRACASSAWKYGTRILS